MDQMDPKDFHQNSTSVKKEKEKNNNNNSFLKKKSQKSSQKSQKSQNLKSSPITQTIYSKVNQVDYQDDQSSPVKNRILSFFLAEFQDARIHLFSLTIIRATRRLGGWIPVRGDGRITIPWTC